MKNSIQYRNAPLVQFIIIIGIMFVISDYYLVSNSLDKIHDLGVEKGILVMRK